MNAIEYVPIYMLLTMIWGANGRLALKRYMLMYYVMDKVRVQGSGIKMVSPAVGRFKKNGTPYILG